MSFMSYNQFCLRICTAENDDITAALQCEVRRTPPPPGAISFVCVAPSDPLRLTSLARPRLTSSRFSTRSVLSFPPRSGCISH